MLYECSKYSVYRECCLILKRFSAIDGPLSLTLRDIYETSDSSRASINYAIGCTLDIAFF